MGRPPLPHPRWQYGYDECKYHGWLSAGDGGLCPSCASDLGTAPEACRAEKERLEQEIEELLRKSKEDYRWYEGREERLRDALEGVGVFYPEALSLIRELIEDAMKVYEPEKGWPPHIEAARNLGDHEQTLADVRKALAATPEREERDG
jgi:hypothetical protein